MLIPYIAEMLRLSTLAGNCGRVVTRFIERTLVRGSDGTFFVVKTGAFAVENLLEMAVFVAYCQDNARLQTPFLEFPGLRLEVAPHLSPFEVSLRVHVEQVPEGVKQRQRMLEAAGRGMDCLVQEHCSVVSRKDMSNLLDLYLGDLVWKRQDPSFAIFEEIVKGQFDRINDCDRRLVSLANLLNTDVAKHVPKSYNLDIEWYDPDEVQDIADAFARDQEAVRTKVAP